MWSAMIIANSFPGIEKRVMQWSVLVMYTPNSPSLG